MLTPDGLRTWMLHEGYNRYCKIQKMVDKMVDEEAKAGRYHEVTKLYSLLADEAEHLLKLEAMLKNQ